MKPFSLIILILFFSLCSNAQEVDPGPGYQMMMISNPAMAGSEGDGILRLSYLNYFPGNSYNLHAVYLSYDSYFPQLHGGGSFYLTDDYQGGIINDIHGGFSYAYFLKAGKDLFINAGLTASIYHRGYNFSNAVLPDQIDPVGGVSVPSSEILAVQGRTTFDIGAGFLFMTGRYSGGFAVNHLAEPDLSSPGQLSNRLHRQLLVHLTGDFSLNENDMKVRPLTFINLQKNYFIGGGGASLEFRYLSFNAFCFRDGGKNLNIQTGFSFTTGKFLVYYNYRFNAISGNKMLPMSLLHQTGLAFSLRTVEKRNTIKTINFPKL